MSDEETYDNSQRLCDSTGALFDTRDANAPIGEPGARAIFVVGPKGELYAAKDHRPGLMHHSSFLAGGEVAAAGHLEVIDGVLKTVSNHSGHYEMPDRLFPQLMGFFSSHGIDTKRVRVIRWGAASEPEAPRAVDVNPEFLQSVEHGLLKAIQIAEQRGVAR